MISNYYIFILSIIFPTHIHTFPASFVGYEAEPVMSSLGKNSLFQFGRARKTEDFKNPTIIVDDKSLPQPITLPKGIFSYTDNERSFDSNFKLPDLDNPIDISGRVGSKNNNINGFYLPMPFGLEPVNIQLFRENERENSMEGAFSAEDKVKSSLDRARRLCRSGITADCNAAFEEYYLIKNAAIDENEAPIHEKILKMGDSIGRSGYANEQRRGLGVLFGMPGMAEPVFMKARFDNFDNNYVSVNANMPKYRT
uniref:Uncharacterized protein n=1 Tax=Rhabditophanes sp. KR3021 TaxID=114890 RepID=A0AC35UIJ1_9BILA